MGKFRITTTERNDGAHEHEGSSSCAPGDLDGSARSLGCLDSCGADTPGYGADAKDISPLTDAQAQE